METWDIYTEDRKKTGRIGVRGEPLLKGEYHLVVFGFIVNENDEILISKRTPNKTFPNTWEITGGSALVGDTSEEAIVREIREELGIQIDGRRGYCVRSVTYEDYFADIWVFRQNIDINLVVCQDEEVSEAKWATLSEIKELIAAKKFIDHSYVLGVLDIVLA